MSIATVQFHSQALERLVSYNIFVPEGPGPYPVLMQLHGYGDNHTSWLHNTKIALYASDYRMIIVMPDGGTSFYLNLQVDQARLRPNPMYKQLYEDFLIQDLRQHITDTYRVREGRWAIGGNSMGGYGALRLGCKYPELFTSIWAHSGVYHDREDLEMVYPDPDDVDLFAITQRLALTGRKNGVEITFDCGSEDYLLENSQRLHAHMQQVGLKHQYIENTGGHWWGYWDEHLPAALKQHMRVFEREAHDKYQTIALDTLDE